MSFITRLVNINTIILDIDGVLTDSSVYISETGEELRRMNIKDGYAIQLAVKMGYRLIVLSGGNSTTVIKRLNRLGIEEVHLMVINKVETLHTILKKYDLTLDQSIYIGDDIPDMGIMKTVSIAACPLDAVPEIKEISHYISDKKGGEGCVRDVIEKVMRARNHWHNDYSLLTRSA